MTTLDALKNLMVALGLFLEASESEAETVAEAIQYIADSNNSE